MKSIQTLIQSKVLLPTLFWSGLLASPLLWADTLSDIAPLQQGWAQVNYQLAPEQREKAFAALVTQADAVVAAHAGEPEPLIWRGIIKSSYAGAKGGLGALAVAESSKADFEAAMALDAQALQGSAYTSLGVLYSKVPGWPIGFGSSKKAQALLEKALTMNPQGIDPNYFYAEFLYEKRDYKEAMRYLEKARQAPPRIGREDADAGRQQEIAQLTAKVQKKLNK